MAKIINGRFVQKHDIEANWLKATGFIPLDGEIIVYEADETCAYPRFKVGDGATNVSDLPFAESPAQADWNQNDPSAPDYVKNRTHWEEDAVILPETVLTMTSDINGQGGMYYLYASLENAPAVGGKCKVKWDGTEYTNTAVDISAMTGGQAVAYALGNTSLIAEDIDMSFDNPDADAPYCIGLFPNGTPADAEGTVAYGMMMSLGITPEPPVLSIDQVVTHKLDPKFMHETVVMAERPELGGEIVILPETVLTNDEGFQIMSPLSATPTEGAIAKVTYNSTEYPCTIARMKEDGVEIFAMGNFDAVGYPLAGGNPNAPFVVLLVPSGATGTYGAVISLDDSTSVALSIVQGSAPIPKQLVTDKDGNVKWEDCTHYKEIITQEVVNLESTELTPLDDDGDGISDGGQYYLTTPWAVDLVVGGKYTVTYDGAPWECYGIDANEIEAGLSGVVVLGNTDAMGIPDIKGGNPNAPFLFICVSNNMASTMGAYGIFNILGEVPTMAFAVSVSGVVTTTVYKELEEGYLPESVRNGGSKQITITIDEYDNIDTGDTTFEDAWAMPLARLQSVIAISTPGAYLYNERVQSPVLVSKFEHTDTGLKTIQIQYQECLYDTGDMCGTSQKIIKWDASGAVIDQYAIPGMFTTALLNYDHPYPVLQGNNLAGVSAENLKTNLGIVDPVFIVTVDNVLNNVGTADKTFAEIKAAYNAGSNVVCKFGGHYHYLLTCNDTQFVFAMNSCADQMVVTRTFTITATEVRQTVYGIQVDDMINDAIAALPQPDWNQNDETAKDYVKNRTHWEEPLVTNTLVDNVSMTVPTNPPYVQNPFAIDIVAGTTYLVTFDNIVYECVAYLDAMYNSPSIGNMAAMNSTMFASSGEPFFVQLYQGSVMFAASSSGTHTVTIQEVVGGGVHKIDSKYIPIQDWNANADEAGYIANRTHWVDYVEGVIVDNLSLTLTDNNGIFTSESIPCEAFQVGEACTIIWDDISYECSVLVGPYMPYIGNISLAYPAAPNTGEPFLIQCGVDSIMFGCSALPTSSQSLTIKKQVESVHKLDVKYLPEFSSNLVDGSATGSIRTVGSKQETGDYTMGDYAVTTGAYTVASGDYSHAEGISTAASSKCQHVQGISNIIDADNKYLHIVGNGSSTNMGGTVVRSNAHTLDWDGNARFAGSIYVNGTGANDLADAKIVATQEYVTEAVNAALAALGLPTPTTADAGKILRVNSNGKYELVSLPNAEEATF